MEASAPAVSPPESAPGLAPLEVRDPATGELIRRVPSLDAAAVAALVADARAAQPGWEALGFRGRAAVFHAAQKWLIDNSERMVDTICAESGKTRDDGQVEISVSAQSFGFWAKMAPKYLSDEKLRSRSPFALGRKVVIRYSPIGVIGVIGPWNYPLVNVFLDAVPALMAGNSVALKPSEVTPLTALLIAEMMDASGIPKGVLQVATGARETGEAVIDECDFVMFTGSTRTGKAVMGARRPHAHAGVARARRQGPADRVRRRRRRPRCQRSCVLLDEQQRADLHLGRARLRRGAGL
jgi:acyl-CoA reductase-like NAD-dependent aldehyde dehydrogenase